MAILRHIKIGPKLPLRIALLVITGVAVFSVLSFSFSFFNKKASSRHQATSEDELDLNKRDLGDLDDLVNEGDEDMHFHWNYSYTSLASGANPCSYFEDNTHFCVPYFLVLGCDCSGQDVLFRILQWHDDISDKRSTGSNPFTERDNFDDFSRDDMVGYVQRFGAAAQEIQENTNEIIGDKGCFLLKGFNISGSEHRDQPKKIAPLFLSHLNPNMKLFFTVRNPVDRFYCCWCKSDDSRGVDQVVTEAIAHFNSCQSNYPMRYCAYIWENLTDAESCITGGLSIIFYEDLLMYFPAAQIMVVHWQDLMEISAKILTKMYSQFLGIGLPGPKFLHAYETYQSGGGGCYRGEMSLKSKKDLYDFYSLYNQQMKIKLKDDIRFNYKEPI